MLDIEKINNMPSGKFCPCRPTIKNTLCLRARGFYGDGDMDFNLEEYFPLDETNRNSDDLVENDEKYAILLYKTLLYLSENNIDMSISKFNKEFENAYGVAPDYLNFRYSYDYLPRIQEVELCYYNELGQKHIYIIERDEK